MIKLTKSFIRVFYPRDGFTMIELVLVMAFVVVVTSVVIMSVKNKKDLTELDTTAKQITSLLREAQSRSMSQSSSTNWGVHFENTTSAKPFYALYYSDYSANTEIGHYRLPGTIAYDTENLAEGGLKNISFSQITGKTTTETIKIYSTMSPANSSTIRVATSGAVTL